MLRVRFLSAKERTALQAVMRHPSETHGVARRANAILLLDDGWNCAKVAEALYLDNDTVRTWFKRYQAGGLEEMKVFDWQGRSGDLSRERMAELSARLGERLMGDSGEMGRGLRPFGLRGAAASPGLRIQAPGKPAGAGG